MHQTIDHRDSLWSNTNMHQYSNIFIKFSTNHLTFHGGLYLFAYQIESMCIVVLGGVPYYFNMTRLQRDIGIQQTQQAYGQELSDFSPNNTSSHYRIMLNIQSCSKQTLLNSSLGLTSSSLWGFSGFPWNSCLLIMSDFLVYKPCSLAVLKTWSRSLWMPTFEDKSSFMNSGYENVSHAEMNHFGVDLPSTFWVNFSPKFLGIEFPGLTLNRLNWHLLSQQTYSSWHADKLCTLTEDTFKLKVK